MKFRKLMLLVTVVLSSSLIWGASESLCQPSGSFLGKWGYVVLGKGAKGSWFGYKTEAGTITVKQDGTLDNSYKESADRCPGPEFCLENATDTLTYSVGEGGVLLIEDSIGCFVADTQNLMLCDGISGREEKGERFLIVAVKLDEVSPYGNDDFSGEYFMGNYEKDLRGETRGYNRLGSAIVISDGLGAITSIEGYENGDGKIRPLSMQNIPLQVSPEGSFLVGDFATGYLDLYRQVGIVSNPSQFYPQTGDDFAAHLLLRKHDRDYSTAHLEGRWAFVGFGDKAGSFRAETGLVECAGDGNCLFSIRTANVNAPAKFLTVTRDLNVSEDGSINGFHLGSDKPHVSGALGNDGNTMIFLMNESGDSPDDRLLGLAVRYSGGNLPGFADLVLKEVSAPTSAVSGEKIYVNFTVQNQGEETAKKRTKASFKLVSQDGSAEIPMGTIYVPKLGPGETFQNSKMLKLKSSLIPAGDYNLVVSLDVTNLVIESREDNNQESSALKIQLSP